VCAPPLARSCQAPMQPVNTMPFSMLGATLPAVERNAALSSRLSRDPDPDPDLDPDLDLDPDPDPDPDLDPDPLDSAAQMQ
jgi:hypothetical protein